MVGSSNKSKSGIINNALAKDILTLHPPEKSFVFLVKSSSLNPNPNKINFALFSASFAPISSIFAFTRSNFFVSLLTSEGSFCVSNDLLISSNSSNKSSLCLSQLNTSYNNSLSLITTSCSTWTIWICFGIPSISFLAMWFNKVVLPTPFLPIRTYLLPNDIFKLASSNNVFPPIWIVNAGIFISTLWDSFLSWFISTSDIANIFSFFIISMKSFISFILFLSDTYSFFSSLPTTVSV